MAAVSTVPAPAFDSVETESELLSLPPKTPARILSISPFPSDHAVLRKVVNSSPWRLTARRTALEAFSELYRTRFIVIFCEFHLVDGTWKDVLDLASNLDEPPLLIVTSQFVDDRVWAEVLNLGGYDVLSKPLVEDEVRRVLHLAMTHRAHPVRKQRAFHAG
jgi:PleD family two-component response regulator